MLGKVKHSVRALPAPARPLAVAEPEPEADDHGPGWSMAPISLEQARAVANAARSIEHRLLIKCLWQTGGRVSEVLGLRPCDVEPADGSIRLANEKQKRRDKRRKLVYVSRDLVAELDAFARGARIRSAEYFFRSQMSGDRPMARSHAWRIVTACARRAGVFVAGQRGELVPAGPLNFRHGSAVHQLREGSPLTEVQRQLGHTAITSTLVYLRITNAERRAIADRVTW